MALLTEAWSPRVILFFPFPSFSLCYSFRMTPWNTGALLAFCVYQGRSSPALLFAILIAQVVILRVPLDPAGVGPRQQPTPGFLPGESQGWRSLVGCRLWGCTELDTTEATQQQQQQQFCYLYNISELFKITVIYKHLSKTRLELLCRINTEEHCVIDSNFFNI